MNTKNIVLQTARLADAQKAEDVKVIDLKGLSSLCDFVVIATATSRPHLEATEENVSRELKQFGVFKTNRDGGESNMWRVSDYGNFMFHLMTKEAREFYALEKIFSFGKVISWQKPVKPAAPKKKAAAKKTKKKPAAKKKK
ncbi:MAG: ribosome silencing factor [Elusimicrobium sp.]|jgi:ribosome silencing factor RsfS/YbeB/iojap|nr:ribosome silencing factor [Elusimicrobium sp.]